MPLAALEATTSVPNHSWHSPHGWRLATFLSIPGQPGKPSY